MKSEKRKEKEGKGGEKRKKGRNEKDGGGKIMEG